jgi:anti-sigma-K factor RskA
MTNPDTLHDEMRAALAAEALGALDGDERARLLAHLAGCEACRAELARMQESAALLAYAAPAAAMDAQRPARLRARLLARAAADRDDSDQTLVGHAQPEPEVEDRTVIGHAQPEDAADRTVIAPAPPVNRPQAEGTRVIPIGAARGRGTALPWLAAAASLVLLLATAAYAMTLRGRLDEMGDRYAAAERDRGRAEQTLAEREATLAAVSAPAVRVIDMASAEQPQPGGRMFWDPRTDRWTFFAHGLPSVGQGREYQLWLITPGARKISAGTFRPGARGEATVQATYALPADSLSAVAVTEEPAGGRPQPSGPVVIAGAMSSR